MTRYFALVFVWVLTVPMGSVADLKSYPDEEEPSPTEEVAETEAATYEEGEYNSNDYEPSQPEQSANEAEEEYEQAAAEPPKPKKKKRKYRRKKRRLASKDLQKSQSTTVRVIKSRRGKALIRHSKKLKLKAGNRYTLTNAGAGSAGDKTETEDSRKHVIGLNLDIGLFNQSTDGTNQDTKIKNLEVNLAYGWNFGILEAALFAEYNFTTVGTFDSRTILGGIFADVNFIRNDGKKDFLLGLRATLGAGSQDNSTQASSGTVIRVQPSLFVKWFGLSTSLAVLGQVGYRLEFTTVSGTKTTTTGLISLIGIQTYF